MSVYPTGGSPSEVLLAMRDQARQTTTALQWAREIRVSGGEYYSPLQTPAVYIMYLGSPETVIGETGTASVRRATHRARIEIVKQLPGLDEDENLRAICGSTMPLGSLR